MNEPEMMELQDVRDENLPSFLVYRPSRISNGLRLMPLRVLGAGMLGILCAGIVFVIANLIIFAAHPSPETQTPDAEIFIDLDLDGEEQIYLDLDLENPIELEELYDQDDLTTPPFIPTPQFMNQEMPNTPSTPQDPTPPVLVFYRPAKTPSRLPKPANGTHLSSPLLDPHPSQAPPRDIPPVTTDCTDSSPCPPALPPYHTPFVTLFTKIKSRFVAITPSITNRFPTSTTPTTTTATNYTTVPSITTTSTPTTATTTVTSSIAVTSAPFVHIIVASPLNIEPTLDLPTEAQTPEKEPVSCGYSRGKVIMYVLLAILIFLLLVVVYEMVKLYRKQPWSLWMADNVRTVEGSAVRRHVVSRHGDTVALRTLRKGSTTFFQVTDANPTFRNPHRQPCCPTNCGIMHSHHHHLPRVSPHCRNHRWLAHPARN